MSATKEMVWTCKVGGLCDDLPPGADAPMRAAVEEAFCRLTGDWPGFTFSGWAGELTEPERAVVENRLPRDEPAALSAVALPAPTPTDLAAPALRLLRAGRQKLATYTSVYPGDKELRRLLTEWDAALASPAASPTPTEPTRGRDDAIAQAVKQCIHFGVEGVQKPPEGHWLTEMWEFGRSLFDARSLIDAIAPPVSAPLTDDFERGRQRGMKQERALWELAASSQEIERAPPAIAGRAAETPPTALRDAIHLAAIDALKGGRFRQDEDWLIARDEQGGDEEIIHIDTVAGIVDRALAAPGAVQTPSPTETLVHPAGLASGPSSGGSPSEGA